MTTQHYISLIMFLTLLSCQTPEIKSVPSSEKLIIGDIDTTKIISQLAVIESRSRLDLSTEKIENLSDYIDTVELTYYFGFCDCQRWIPSEIHKKALAKHTDLDEPDPRGQIQFNLDKHGFYIEAANKELELDWRPQVNGTTIRFIGREYTDKRLPKNEGFTVADPSKGKVFRYYSYQILHPYKIWGPRKFIAEDKETGENIEETTILTVK